MCFIWSHLESFKGETNWETNPSQVIWACHFSIQQMPTQNINSFKFENKIKKNYCQEYFVPIILYQKVFFRKIDSFEIDAKMF